MLSFPLNTLVTNPIGHWYLVVCSCWMGTRSPTSRLECSLTHLVCFWSVGRYSLSHLFQNRSAIYCTWRQHRLYWSWGKKSPGASLLPDLRSRWLGVKGVASVGSPESLVIGIALIILSTMHIRVDRPSSTNGCCPISPRSIDRMVRNTQPYLLTWLLALLTVNGPK